MKLLNLLSNTKSVNENLVERYGSSSDFDSELTEIQNHINAAIKIAQSPNFAEFLKSSDENYENRGAAVTETLKAMTMYLNYARYQSELMGKEILKRT